MDKAPIGNNIILLNSLHFLLFLNSSNNMCSLNYTFHLCCCCQDSPLAGSFVCINFQSFALIIYGWMWTCRGQDMRLIHLRIFQGRVGFIKGSVPEGVHTRGLINLNFFAVHHFWFLCLCTPLILCTMYAWFTVINEATGYFRNCIGNL